MMLLEPQDSLLRCCFAPHRLVDLDGDGHVVKVYFDFIDARAKPCLVKHWVVQEGRVEIESENCASLLGLDQLIEVT